MFDQQIVLQLMKYCYLDHLCILEKSSGPKIELWGTLASIGDHEDVWPFKRAHWNPSLKKLLIRFRGVPEILVDWIL